jgi:hypothetical protein
MIMGSDGALKIKNDCAGEGQQKCFLTGLNFRFGLMCFLKSTVGRQI